MQGAAKVGVLVVVFVGLLVGAYSLLGRSLFAPEPNLYYATFRDAGGISPGAKVLMAGVQIGKVQSVSLRGPSEAVLTLGIDKNVRIPQGSSASMPTALIGLGDSPVQIVPPAEPTAIALAPGSTLNGVREGPLAGILPKSDETMSEINKTLVSLRKLLEDADLKNSITGVAKAGEDTIKKFGALADQAQAMIAQNRGALTAILNHATLAVRDIRQSTLLVRKMIDDPRYKDNALAIMESLKATADKANELAGSLDTLVNDPKLRNSLTNIVQNAETISDSGTKIAGDAEQIAKNTSEITKNGVTISEEVVTLSRKANEIADEAKDVLQKIKGFFDRTPGAGGVKIAEVGMDLLRDTRPNYWRTDFNVALGVPGSGTSYHFGLFDAFESNRITAQIGRNIGGANELRYGVYASKPGVGVDYALGPKAQLRGDLFDINNPRFDLRLRYDFGNGVMGWLGMDRLFSRNSPIIGIGVRR
jgi:phospholipid/cholesterol/gamma-HCH transport system substrate-binding protein